MTSCSASSSLGIADASANLSAASTVPATERSNSCSEASFSAPASFSFRDCFTIGQRALISVSSSRLRVSLAVVE
jgi:hypothetical protein